MDVFGEIKASFKKGSVLTRLIYVNLFVFLAISLTGAILYLFEIKTDSLYFWLSLPASPSGLLFRPYTIVSYMFTHFRFLHVLFNVLILYWFGRLFLQYLSGRQLLGVYVWGGLAGALVFIVSYNVFPVFLSSISVSGAVGASASVMAVLFAIATLVPQHEVHMLFFGRVKLMVLALIVIAIDIISIPFDNPGGHIAHVGGSVFGVLFALQYRKGKDITAGIVKTVYALADIFKPKPVMHVSSHNKSKKSHGKSADMEYNARKKAEQDEINAILDKVARSGYGSLTAAEKEKLFKMSSKK